MSRSSNGLATYATLPLELRQKILLRFFDNSTDLDIKSCNNMVHVQQGFRNFSAPTTFLPTTHTWASTLKSTHQLVVADLIYVLKSKLDELDDDMDYWKKIEMGHDMELGGM